MATEGSEEPFSLNIATREKLVQILFANSRALTLEEILASFPGEDNTLIEIELDLLTRGDAKGAGKNHFFKQEKDPETSVNTYVYRPPKDWMFFDNLEKYIVHEVLPSKGFLYEKESNIEYLLHTPISRAKLEEIAGKRGLRNYLADIVELKILLQGKTGEYYFNAESYRERKRISVKFQLDQIFNLFKNAVKNSQVIPDIGFHDIQVHAISELPFDLDALENLAKKPESIWEIAPIKKGSTGKRISAEVPVTWGIVTLAIFSNENVSKEGITYCKMHVTFKGINLPQTSLKAAIARKGAPAKAKSWIPKHDLGKFVTQLELIFLQQLEAPKIIKFSHKDIGDLFIPFSMGINYDAEDEALKEEFREKGRMFLKKNLQLDAGREMKLSQYPILLRHYCYENAITGQLWHRLEEHVSGKETAELIEGQLFDGAFGFNGSQVRTESLTNKLEKHLASLVKTQMDAMQRTYGVQDVQTNKLTAISENIQSLIKEVETANDSVSNIREGVGEEISAQVTTLVQTIEKDVSPLKTEQETLQKNLNSIIQNIKDLTETALPDLIQDLQTLSENMNRGFQELQEQNRQLIESQTKTETSLTKFIDVQADNNNKMSLALTQLAETHLKTEQQMQRAEQQIQEQSQAIFISKLSFFKRKKYLKQQKIKQ